MFRIISNFEYRETLEKEIDQIEENNRLVEKERREGKTYYVY